MWTLGLDTATWTASVGVVHDGRAISERTERAETSLALAIIPLIDDALRAAGIGVTDLDAVAVSVGPGSFTGLRVGVSTAKGIAYAAGAQLVAVPTLTALARAAGPRAGVVCTVLDARKSEVYAACFEWRDGTLACIAPERALPPAQLRDIVDVPCTFVGDGVDFYGDILRKLFGDRAQLVSLATAPPSGCVIAQMGTELIAAGEQCAIDALEPRYVRASEAELKAG